MSTLCKSSRSISTILLYDPSTSGAVPSPTEEETIHETSPGNPGRSLCAVRLFFVSRASIRAPQALLGRLWPHGRLMPE